MRCTDCSEVVRPIICLDIDGTLGNYHEHFVDFCIGYFGKTFSYGWDGQGDWEDWLGLTQRQYRDAKLAFRQGGMKRTMPAFKDAAQMSLLLGAVAEVWITTTRPYNRLDSVDPDTQEWLRRNNIYFEHLLYDEHKYRRLAELVDPDRVCGVLEDLPEQYDIAAEVFGPDVPILRDGDHNHLAGRSRNRASTLAVATQTLMEKVELWRMTHD